VLGDVVGAREVTDRKDGLRQIAACTAN